MTNEERELIERFVARVGGSGERRIHSKRAHDAAAGITDRSRS